MENILVTGGRGFIGFNFIKQIANKKNINIINLDKRSYSSQKGYIFKSFNNVKDIKMNICNQTNVTNIIKNYKPNKIVNFAAESHVDRSIENPKHFIENNILSTFSLLEGCLRGLPSRHKYKFIQISTDEVYGSITKGSATTSFPMKPSSPYSSSKAASENIAYSYYKTFNMPIIITNCTNNYGPYQFPEKLIPLTIFNALNNKKISIYGNGTQSRDWLHVDDHITAILKIIKSGKPGGKYHIGSNHEISNLKLVKIILKIIAQSNKNIKYNDLLNLISFVTDRPAHDLRYSLDITSTSKLHWTPKLDFEFGLKSTVNWYLENSKWIYKNLQNRYDGKRIGLLK